MSPAHSRGRRFLVGSLIALAVVAGGYFLLRPAPAGSGEGLATGRPAPGFAVRDLAGGQPIRLSDLRGQVVVANFWATWCISCRTEMPALEQVYQQYRDQGLVVLGLNIGGESDVSVRSFAERYQLTFPIGIDDGGAVTGTYKVISLPSTYIIGRDGVIRRMVPGAVTEEQLEQMVAEALQAG